MRVTKAGPIETTVVRGKELTNLQESIRGDINQDIVKDSDMKRGSVTEVQRHITTEVSCFVLEPMGSDGTSQGKDPFR
jgi:hypothetical protein